MATTATRPWTRVPKLIVFDLDFTLWYPEMYELAGAPFRRSAKGVVTARDGEEALSTSEKAMQRRKGLNSKCETLANLVQYQAIYPTNKRVHFKQLADDSGVAFSDMLFFDNEYSNIRDISAIGVTSIYCPDGLTWDVWEQGMAAFQCK
ncbi:hypothetical protein DYB32_003985 [Aphanomyces invadans]|uniref:Magnesium-dependent phosphatase-1 n=1 Tax=Aphanomyces invadans TaxID=157072 RepID=A0A418AYV1_9STRA|nr:hypothetical protein DYB32_003985 [Aphanomyces invadans]